MLKHRQLGKSGPLPGLQQVPRPIERCAQGRMAPRTSTRGWENGETVIHALEERLGREYSYTRRSELDRQRQTVEELRNPKDRRAVVVSRAEGGLRSARALQKEGGRVLGLERSKRQRELA